MLLLYIHMLSFHCPNKWTREFCEIIKPVKNKTFIDVGAAFGYELDVALQNGYSNLIGFECRSDEYQRLLTKFQHYSSVTLIHACVSNSSGIQKLWRAKDSSSLIEKEIKHALWKAKRETRKYEYVPVVKLDDIEERMKIEGDVSLIKIDVQGYEPYVISGAEKLIRKFHPDIFYEISNLWDFDGKKLIEYVFGNMMGYTCKCKYNCFCSIL